jgi:endonuclease/exonuclease/phosphatase family metal-dependent hydrolase
MGLLLGPGFVAWAVLAPAVLETNTPVRVMAANLTGDSQSYQPPAIRIFQGLKPDIVAIQEFRYLQNQPADFRALVDTGFGTNFVYFREPGYDSGIPNGIISRFPILATGTWPSGVSNRGFAWARLDLPGTNDLVTVSVHFKAGSSDAATRATQAVNLRNLIQASFPDRPFLVVAGDFNFQNRSETALTTLKTLLSDDPVPTDAETGGNPNTNQPRSRPYDLVLPNAAFRTHFAPLLLGTRSFPNGLVFDSRAYTPLAAVAPVLAADSGTAQHMAVLKAFRVPHLVTNWVEVPPPALALDPAGAVRWVGVPGVAYRVEASVDLTAWDTAGTVQSATGDCVFPYAPAPMAAQYFRVGAP